MDEFVVDAGLFAKAQDKIVAASEAFSSISSLLSSVKANFPEEYEFKGEVIDACSDIEEAKKYVETFKSKVAEVCANIASLDEEFAKEVYSPKWYEDIWNAYKKSGAELKRGVKSWAAGEGTGKLKKGLKDTGATIAVTGTSIAAGALKLVEYIDDGGTYAEGVVRYGVEKIKDKKNGTKNASRVWDETLDKVRVDKVGDLYNAFYDTKLGKNINKASNLKYDGKGAQALRTGGEFAGKVALATAATIVTGGTAAPVVLGALYGVGKAEERYAQSVDREHGESYDIKRANTKAVVNAITGAAEFYGYGQIGGMIATRASMKGAAGSIKDMIASGTKVEGKTFAKNFAKNFFVKDTLYDSAAVVADHAGNVYLGDETFNQALKSGGGELALALGLNMLGAGMGAYVESATPVVKNVDDIVDISKKTPFQNINRTEELFEKNYGVKAHEINPKVVKDVNETREIVDTSAVQKASPVTIANARPDYFDQIEHKVKNSVSNRQISIWARRLNVSEERVKQILDEKIVAFFEEGEFGVRKSQATLERILYGDGMIKNQFETHTSGGLNDPDTRINIEEELFGVSPNANIEDRPIYGMVFPSLDDYGTIDYIRNGPGYWYGNEDGIVFILDKQKVIDSTTYTIGDSLDYKDYVSAGLATAPKFDSSFPQINRDIFTIEDLENASLIDLFSYKSGDEYLELQFHGADSHKLENVKEIIFTKTIPNQTILDELTKRQIKFRIAS